MIASVSIKFFEAQLINFFVHGKDIDQLFAKDGLFEEKEGSCSELNSLIDKCIDCREAWEDMKGNCFRNGASGERNKRYGEIKDMEKISKETLEMRKNKNLCK